MLVFVSLEPVKKYNSGISSVIAFTELIARISISGAACNEINT
jgi:hypothetical protein